MPTSLTRPFFGRMLRPPLEQVAEEHVGLVAAAVDLLLLAREAVVDQQALVRAVVVELVEHVLDLPLVTLMPR